MNSSQINNHRSVTREGSTEEVGLTFLIQTSNTGFENKVLLEFAQV